VVGAVEYPLTVQVFRVFRTLSFQHRPLGLLRQHALEIVRAALAAVFPVRLIQEALADSVARDSIIGVPLSVVAAGKAAEGMVRGLMAVPGVEVARGVAVGPAQRTSLPEPFAWYAAGHPLPNGGSVDAGRAALRCARETGPSERLLVLLSGGASALLAAPVAGVTLAEKVEATRLLLASGVPIHELNCVRKHLSSVKGGRLALAAAGPTLTLAISDVVSPREDDPEVIGSGPTVPDGTSYAEALDIARRAAGMPAAVLDVLKQGCAGAVDETLKPDDSRVCASSYRVIGSRRQAMDGALRAARALGYTASAVDTPVTGEARVTGPLHIEGLLGLSRAQQRQHSGPACLVSSGETTVTVTGPGRGGRNQEMALAAASRLRDAGMDAVFASVGTDGIDGPTDAAGAFVDGTTVARARAAGLEAPSRYLESNDSHRFFSALGDLIVTGPTGTNVGDLQIVLTDGIGKDPS
jgi:glycerate-2-kinase